MMDNKSDRKALGRGLSALMADVNLDVTQSMAAKPAIPDTNLPIESITPNPDQPRRSFDSDALNELAESIRQKGIIQPLIVRPKGGGRYEIVAGERRWRAAQIANLHSLPVLVRDLSDSEMLEIAIIENIQRADLNAIDEAQAYRQLMDRFGHTQEKIAESLSRSRSHIANLLRLLTLPDSVQNMVRNGTLTAGHARALIGKPDAQELANQIASKGLSVRAVEGLTRRPTEGRTKSVRLNKNNSDADTKALEADLSANLKTSVSIRHDPMGHGILSIGYANLDQLDALCRALSLIDINENSILS
jgi:ParB family transcriptional regulator, chromosome partitioning protein